MAHSLASDASRLSSSRLCLPLLAVLALLSSPLSAGSDPGVPPGAARGLDALDAAVKGRVFGETRPVASASVFAYDVVSRAVQRVLTDGQGHFLFSALPKGMYQIVAFKRGFAPAVESLLRRRDDLHQFIELQLKEEATGDVRAAEDYWTVRSRIPGDIFREIHALELRGADDRDPGAYLESSFAGQMRANSGVEQLAGDLGEAQLTTAELDLQGSVGDFRVGLEGTYQQLAQTGERRIPDGQVSALALEIENSQQDSRLRLATGASETSSIYGDEVQPVDLEYYRFDWTGKVGDKSRSGVSAQYTEELGFHETPWVQVADIPEASRLLNVEGFFKSEVTENTSVEAGVSFRQFDGQVSSLADFAQAEQLVSAADLAVRSSLAADGSIFGYGSALTDEAIGLYGLAASQIRPRVLVEYGLFSRVRDGSLSLMPQGGMVVQLGDTDWKARTSLAHRLDEEREDSFFTGFGSALYNDRSSCQRAGEACYEVTFTRGKKDDEISLGAIHRKYAETLQIYFSPDFFNRLESVFVVDGDTVPELQFRMVRRMSPRILAKLESNFAAGGGGIFYATNDALSYENEVRYLVTSLDTQFQQTSTGVFVAFHHLEQALNPIDQPVNGGIPEIEVQRLQLMLTQDLNVLANMTTSNWAVRLNVELSRGSTPYTLSNDDEISHKYTGGLSVSF